MKDLYNIIMIIFVLVVITLVGCTPKEEGPQSFVQQKFANVSDTPNDYINNKSMALKCDYYGIDTYVNQIFIYSVNGKGDQTILTPQGTYFKPKDYPNWQFKIFLNSENNTYTKRKGFIDSGVFPNGDVLACETVDRIPSKFNKFIETHPFLITKPKKEE
jgi:hypothetical protein